MQARDGDDGRAPLAGKLGDAQGFDAGAGIGEREQHVARPERRDIGHLDVTVAVMHDIAAELHQLVGEIARHQRGCTDADQMDAARAIQHFQCLGDDPLAVGGDCLLHRQKLAADQLLQDDLVVVADLDRTVDHAGRNLPILRLGLADRQLELLIAGIAQFLAELDDTRLAAADLGRQRRRRQAQHPVGIVENVLADLAIAGRHGVELHFDLLQDGHAFPELFRMSASRRCRSRNKLFQPRLTAKNDRSTFEACRVDPRFEHERPLASL